MKKLILTLILILITSVGCASNVEPAPNVDEVTVIRVIDGDTIQVLDNANVKHRVRLIGVDTPETKHPTKPVQYYGKEAYNYTKKTLENKKVYLEYDVGKQDKYNRILAYVWLEKPVNNSDKEIRSKMFNAQLLLNGYAQLMTIQPNVSYVEGFKTYQKEAREKNKGLWNKR